jgi:nitroreductase
MRRTGRMDVTEAVFGRRSIRQFSDEPVDAESIERLLRAAFAGPIGTRRECRYFVVVGGREKDQLIGNVLEPGLARLARALEDCQARETVAFTRSLIQPLRSAPVVIAAYMELMGWEPVGPRVPTTSPRTSVNTSAFIASNSWP